MSIQKIGISGMELSFTSIGCHLDREQIEVQQFQRADYKAYKVIDGFSYLIARSNITIYFDAYDESKTIKQNIDAGLKYLFDNKIIKNYDYHQGMVSLTHYIVSEIPTSEPLMDKEGCREAEGIMTRFSVIYKFKIGVNRKLINHPSPTASISKSLASLHKINILSKGSNLEIKAIFSLNNSSSKGNKKFIKNNLHYRLISYIIDFSLTNLMDKEQ